MKVIAAVAVIIVLAGCSKQYEDRDRRAGEIRRELFIECMNLSAKMPRQSDDDVADIIEECGSQSYYMSYAITKK